MRTLIFILFLFLFLFICHPLFCQTIWNFKESRTNGVIKEYKENEINFHIDISSQIFIEFNRANLREVIVNKTKNNSGQLNSLLSKIKSLQALSETGLAELPLLSEKLKDLNNENLSVNEKQQIIKNAFSNISFITLQIISAAEKDEEFYSLLNSALEEAVTSSENSYGLQYLKVFEATRNYAESLKEKMEDLISAEGIYIQMAASLYGQNGNIVPIHFDGFDDFKPADFYDPYELKLALADEQLKELEKLRFISDSINKKGLPAVVNNFGKNLNDSIIVPAITGLENTFDSLKLQLLSLLDKNFQLPELNRRTNDLYDMVINTETNAREFRAKYSNPVSGSDAEVQSQLIKDINYLLKGIIAVKNQTVNLIAYVNMQLVNADGNLRRTLLEFENYVNTKTSEKLEQGKKIFDCLAFEITGYRTIHDINSLTVQFTEEVKKLDIGDLPESTVMDIKNYAGYRQEGDNIILEMRAGKNNKDPFSLGKQYFTLMKMQPHIVTNTGLVFTNQIGSGNDGKYLASPGVSTVFKFGTNGKSTFYRKFLDFGIGVNLTTLNFSEENSIEVGAAIVGTAFSDYFQTGWGYNLTQGQFYWLIGFRIPFLSKEFDL